VNPSASESTVCKPIVRRIQRSENGVELLLHVPPALLYFRGHFPGFAILPGIVQIDWALMLARDYLLMPGNVAIAMLVKFARPIRPGTDLQLALDYANASRLLRFEYRDENWTYGSGRIELGADGF
jgi:3-hydroxymyristoyl/3-hydroxydecanoyl-(acyl carrier protein) dehydratase